MNDAALRKLEQTLAAEMPICTPMGIRPVAWDGCRLSMEMPLSPNRNHQYSAFAGSLNALCTIVGWGKVFLMLHHAGLSGNIVIRRSHIRYLRPVRTDAIVAHNLPIDREAETFFFELLRSHGASKIDVNAEVADREGPLVSFHGSYVVQDCSTPSSF
jgi:thioesterase domain-containing protein